MGSAGQAHHDTNRRVRPLLGATVPQAFTMPVVYKDAVFAAAAVLGISASELIRVLIEESPYTNEFLPIQVRDELQLRRPTER